MDDRKSVQGCLRQKGVHTLIVGFHHLASYLGVCLCLLDVLLFQVTLKSTERTCFK